MTPLSEWKRADAHIPVLKPITVTVRQDYTILELFEQDAARTISEADKRKLDEWCTEQDTFNAISSGRGKQEREGQLNKRLPSAA